MRPSVLLLSMLCLSSVGQAAAAGRGGTNRRREAALERCLRHVVEARGLNEYGDAKDVLYPGGTPLFDESTGTATPWLEYMKKRHPELVRVCRSRKG